MAKPEYLSISRQNLENSNGQEPDYYDLCIDVMDGPVTTNNEVKVDISNPGNVTIWDFDHKHIFPPKNFFYVHFNIFPAKFNSFHSNQTITTRNINTTSRHDRLPIITLKYIYLIFI